MKLSKLVENLYYDEIHNIEDVDITGISYNSKTTKSGDIFVCLVGEHSDGHEFFQDAINNGAVALMVERIVQSPIPQIVVKNTRKQIAYIAETFNEYPSKNLNLIGVTGTNGKTTVTHLIQKIFEADGEKCSLIGTLGYKLSSDDTYHDAKHTTPQAPELQTLFKKIKNEFEIRNVVMEVSSHALDQNRVGGCNFNGAVLTNLTQDHLDYHITMENYFKAKVRLFEDLVSGDFAVINADDKYAERFMEKIKQGVRKYTYGINNNADIMAKNISFSETGATFTCVTPRFEREIKLKMNGMFSIYNVLAALATAYATNLNLENALIALESIQGVAGRFEVVTHKPIVIIDYAHTPDGLENVLKAAREITPDNGKLLCVFGCGGDRDATKRPKMGAIAERLADKIIITSDNPRSEDPQQIITDILAGLNNTNNVIVEPDRGSAISLLPSLSSEQDVIVIAGKGHEDYQILKNETIHFDDKEVAKQVFGITQCMS